MSPVRQIQLWHCAKTSSVRRTQKIRVDENMSSLSLISSVYPLAIILALTVLPFCLRTHRGLMIFLHVLVWVGWWELLCKLLVPSLAWSLVSFLLLILLLAPCQDLRCWWMLVTQGSRRIFSVLISCSSSLDSASIFCPFSVVTVTADILILVVGGPWAVSRLLAAVALSSVLACFVELPCAMSSETSLLPGVGIGSGALACCVDGAVATGNSVSAGVVVGCCPVAAGCCGVCVSVLVVSCCFFIAGCGITAMLGAAVLVILAGEALMTSTICLLYLSGLICLLWWSLLWPRCFWCQGCSDLLRGPYPARWLGRTLLPSLTNALLLVACKELFNQIHKLGFCVLYPIVCSSLCCHPSGQNTCWAGMLHAWQATAWWDACCWACCHSCSPVGAWWPLLGSWVLCGHAPHCLVLVMCRQVIVLLLR